MRWLRVDKSSFSRIIEETYYQCGGRRLKYAGYGAWSKCSDGINIELVAEGVLCTLSNVGSLQKETNDQELPVPGSSWLSVQLR